MGTAVGRVITVEAPAKVNLYLGVSPVVTDGRHGVETVLQALSLSDTVSIAVCDGEPEIRQAAAFVCGPRSEGLVDDRSSIPLEDNLVTRAIRSLSERIGHPLDKRYTFSILKFIPLQGGLGGGSSDCAAALLALARLWNLDPLGPECMDVARALGSDIAFFLYGGCALMGGFGDILEKQLNPLAAPVVLIRPDEGVSTGAAYRAFDEDPCPIGPASALTGVLGERSDAAGAGRPGAAGLERLGAVGAEHLCVADVDPAVDADAAAVPIASDRGRQAVSLLANNLAPASYRVLPGLEAQVDWLGAQDGVVKALLAGSGSTCFGLCESAEAAERVAKEARMRGLWAHSCETISTGARIISDSAHVRND